MGNEIFFIDLCNVAVTFDTSRGFIIFNGSWKILLIMDEMN